MSKSKALKLDWNTALRALGFAMVGVGSFAIGGSLDGLNEVLVGDMGLPQFVIIFIAIALATVGATAHGILGLILFAAGNALLGATLLSGFVLHWGQTIGFVALTVGVFLRMMIDG